MAEEPDPFPPPTAATWAYAEGYGGEDHVAAAARSRAAALPAPPVSPGAATALRLFAAAVSARHVVEIGTGTGVSGLALLAGMAADGVLTSVDVSAEHQRVARATFTAAGYPASRIRLIAGRALDVLPRLTDAAYDLVFVDGEKAEYPAYLEQALRLLRPGGIVVFDNALWHDRVADPAQRDADTVALREVGTSLREDERLVPALLTVGDGLLAAVLRS
ncbi:MAG: O-methyltransferase [Actinomycetota bacterium]|nr:MAG: O-methyltransferase [Actinomycetota bacterium]